MVVHLVGPYKVCTDCGVHKGGGSFVADGYGYLE